MVIPVPLGLLVPVSKAVQIFFGNGNPIHPVRVRKAATSTHIVPQRLIDLGFEFKYDFMRSLEHWRRVSSADFDFSLDTSSELKRLTLIRKAEDGFRFDLGDTVERESVKKALTDDD